MALRCTWGLTTATILLGALSRHNARPTPPSFRLSEASGRTILSDEDLVQYRWATHTMVLTQGTVARLQTTHRLAGTFTVVANGANCYRGHFVSPILSAGFAGAVIVLPATESVAATSDTLSITLGYPDGRWTNGDDPRGDPRVLESLTALGKIER